MPRTYALLVGINAYPPSIPQLSGCLNDIENARSYLADTHADAAIVVLKDADATRANVIGQFRNHLGRAGRGDVAIFQYCGHGATSTGAHEFNQFDLSGRDEGLVLVDSRLADDTFDLADKELAILLSELAARDPHIALVLDCCHSGSGTRDLAAFPSVVRNTEGKFPPRPIESYLEGQYAKMTKAGALNIPNGRHMLLAACDRSQKAKEDSATHAGYFTTALYDVLRHSGPLTYAELFVRARAAVRQRIRSTGDSDQDPQFEPVDGFDCYRGVFGAAADARRRTYVVSGGPDWRVEFGAIEGMPTDPAKPVTMILHPENDTGTVSGTARVAAVGAQTSAVQLDFTPADPAQRFVAEITSMPQAPMLVAFEGNAAPRAIVKGALEGDPAQSARLAEAGADDGFSLVADETSVSLVQRDTGKSIRSVAIDAGAGNWANPILEALAHIAQWRRSLTLANPHPKMDPAMVDFVFAEQPQSGGELIHSGPDFQLQATRAGDSWNDVRGELRIRNRTGQLLNYVLVHFSNDFGVHALTNEQIVPSENFQTILIPRKDGTGDPRASFSLDEGRETTENLKLILSTERVDDFLLELAPLTDTRGFGSADDAAEAAKPVTDDWFAKDLRVRIAPGLDEVGPQPVSIAGGRIVIEQHPEVTATVSLATAGGPARGVSGDAAFVNRLNAAGLTLPAIGGDRGESSNILQLTNISKPEALAKTPLAITLDVPLGDGELLVPLINDGGYMMLAGDVWRDEAGKTQVRISSLPAEAAAQRGIGSALWIYLCKAYFHSDDVNKLRWVEKSSDGIAAHADGLAEKVAASRSVLLVVHGIIGDTEQIANAVLRSGIAEQFDLVLSYDYENLATSIEDTAKALKDDLARAGIRADDGKKLVILAHSMGGLVARWFVEKEGGAEIVDRLVLCGTPNEGSPFGKIDTARQILTILATLAVNVPALTPVCGSALAVLTYSKRLTPTLEEMAPHSPFISTLFGDADAGVPITILAGDIDSYRDGNSQFFDELLVKLGRGPALDALFGNSANDLAVAVSSICASTSPALGKAERMNVACHHLNYFQSDAGIGALKSLDWTA